MTVATDRSPDGPPESTLDPAAVDGEAAVRGTLYALLARAFSHPDEALHEALTSGALADEFAALAGRSGLDLDLPRPATDDDLDTLSARFNDVFVLGYAEYEDRTDGSLSTTEPPVPPFESAYRPNASWTDVNLDLARAYDYYGVEPNREDRQHHDHLRLELEFAGYLARREAAVDGPDAARARLDFLDRHLRILVEGMAERMADEVGTGVYDTFVDCLDAVTAADRRDLLDRLEEG